MSDRTIKSHVDFEKIERFPFDEPFEYKDVVVNDLHLGSKAPIDAEKFKEEVKKGIYNGINVVEDKGVTTIYIKNKV